MTVSTQKNGTQATSKATITDEKQVCLDQLNKTIEILKTSRAVAAASQDLFSLPLDRSIRAAKRMEKEELNKGRPLDTLKKQVDFLFEYISSYEVSDKDLKYNNAKIFLKNLLPIVGEAKDLRDLSQENQENLLNIVKVKNDDITKLLNKLLAARMALTGGVSKHSKGVQYKLTNNALKPDQIRNVLRSNGIEPSRIGKNMFIIPFQKAAVLNKQLELFGSAFDDNNQDPVPVMLSILAEQPAEDLDPVAVLSDVDKKAEIVIANAAIDHIHVFVGVISNVVDLYGVKDMTDNHMLSVSNRTNQRSYETGENKFLYLREQLQKTADHQVSPSKPPMSRAISLIDALEACDQSPQQISELVNDALRISSYASRLIRARLIELNGKWRNAGKNFQISFNTPVVTKGELQQSFWDLNIIPIHTEAKKTIHKASLSRPDRKSFEAISNKVGQILRKQGVDPLEALMADPDFDCTEKVLDRPKIREYYIQKIRAAELSINSEKLEGANSNKLQEAKDLIGYIEPNELRIKHAKKKPVKEGEEQRQSRPNKKKYNKKKKRTTEIATTTLRREQLAARRRTEDSTQTVKVFISDIINMAIPPGSNDSIDTKGFDQEAALKRSIEDQKLKALFKRAKLYYEDDWPKKYEIEEGENSTHAFSPLSGELHRQTFAELYLHTKSGNYPPNYVFNSKLGDVSRSVLIEEHSILRKDWSVLTPERQAKMHSLRARYEKIRREVLQSHYTL